MFISHLPSRWSEGVSVSTGQFVSKPILSLVSVVGSSSRHIWREVSCSASVSTVR